LAKAVIRVRMMRRSSAVCMEGARRWLRGFRWVRRRKTNRKGRVLKDMSELQTGVTVERLGSVQVYNEKTKQTIIRGRLSLYEIHKLSHQNDV